MIGNYLASNAPISRDIILQKCDMLSHLFDLQFFIGSGQRVASEMRKAKPIVRLLLVGKHEVSSLVSVLHTNHQKITLTPFARQAKL
jgi:hypothetical protein